MYVILADDKPIWTPGDTDKRLINPNIKLEVNKVGSASFKVLPGHAFYNSFVKMQTVITIIQDSRTIFKGRVYSDSLDFRNVKSIEVEGILGYFNDSIVRPYEFNGSPTDYLDFLISQHNNQVESFQRFKLGRVTVVDNNNYIVRANTDSVTTWKEIEDKLINLLGGYIVIRYEEDGNYIDYLADYEDTSTQDIAFSVNLLDLTSVTKSDKLATCIIPYGANDAETSKRIDITSVNDGLDYITYPEAVEVYGRITEVVTWDDVTLPENLLSRARTYLSDRVRLTTQLTIKAIDLHLADNKIEGFKIGDYIRVYSTPHNIDSVVLLTAYNMDLSNPANSTITLGLEKSSYLGDVKKDNVNRVDTIIKEATPGITQNVISQTQTYVDKQITNLLDLIYPIGSIFMSVNNVNPGALFGGTWVQIKDRFLLSAGDTYSAGSSGGEATHTLTIDEIPSHEGHLQTNNTNWNGNNTLFMPNTLLESYGTNPRGWSSQGDNEVVPAGESKGGGGAHNNMPPYLTVYMWKRTE